MVPVQETGCSSVFLGERAEDSDPEETPGSEALLETDCNCCPHHMTSYRPKPLETVSLRGGEEGGEG